MTKRGRAKAERIPVFCERESCLANSSLRVKSAWHFPGLLVKQTLSTGGVHHPLYHSSPDSSMKALYQNGESKPWETAPFSVPFLCKKELPPARQPLSLSKFHRANFVLKQNAVTHAPEGALRFARRLGDSLRRTRPRRGSICRSPVRPAIVPASPAR